MFERIKKWFSFSHKKDIPTTTPPYAETARAVDLNRLRPAPRGLNPPPSGYRPAVPPPPLRRAAPSPLSPSAAERRYRQNRVDYERFQAERQRRIREEEEETARRRRNASETGSGDLVDTLVTLQLLEAFKGHSTSPSESCPAPEPYKSGGGGNYGGGGAEGSWEAPSPAPAPTYYSAPEPSPSPAPSYSSSYDSSPSPSPAPSDSSYSSND